MNEQEALNIIYGAIVRQQGMIPPYEYYNLVKAFKVIREAVSEEQEDGGIPEE